MQIIDQYDYLIHLICCGMHGTQPQEKPNNISFEDVLECGIRHEVAQFAFFAVQKLKSQPSEATLRHWKETYYQATIRNVKQDNARKEILTALHNRGIHTLEVQGTTIKQYYPQPNLRMMSDLDFIIPIERLEDAEDIMKILGYETKTVAQGTEIKANKEKIFVELHTDFFNNVSAGQFVLHDWETYVTSTIDGNDEIPKTIFYLYHILHTIKHLRWCGIGIRRIIDLFYLDTALKNIVDYEYIKKILEEYGYRKDMENLLSLTEYCFGNKCIDIDNELFVLMNEIKVAEKHGTPSIAIAHQIQKQNTHHFKRIRYFFSVIFLRKELIYRSYPICEKYGFPIIVCWLYRALCVIFVKEHRRNVVSRLKILKNSRV